SVIVFVAFFFFQAEDGIRAFHVTGVQTCALPICWSAHRAVKYREPVIRCAPAQRAFSIPLRRWQAGVVARLLKSPDRLKFREREIRCCTHPALQTPFVCRLIY